MIRTPEGEKPPTHISEQSTPTRRIRGRILGTVITLGTPAVLTLSAPSAEAVPCMVGGRPVDCGSEPSPTSPPTTRRPVSTPTTRRQTTATTHRASTTPTSRRQTTATTARQSSTANTAGSGTRSSGTSNSPAPANRQPAIANVDPAEQARLAAEAQAAEQARLEAESQQQRAVIDEAAAEAVGKDALRQAEAAYQEKLRVDRSNAPVVSGASEETTSTKSDRPLGDIGYPHLTVGTGLLGAAGVAALSVHRRRQLQADNSAIIEPVSGDPPRQDNEHMLPLVPDPALAHPYGEVTVPVARPVHASELV